MIKAMSKEREILLSCLYDALHEAAANIVHGDMELFDQMRDLGVKQLSFGVNISVTANSLTNAIANKADINVGFSSSEEAKKSD